MGPRHYVYKQHGVRDIHCACSPWGRFRSVVLVSRSAVGVEWVITATARAGPGCINSTQNFLGRKFLDPTLVRQAEVQIIELLVVTEGAGFERFVPIVGLA